MQQHHVSSPLLSLPGATECDPGDDPIAVAGVAWHYGNPLGEQRAFASSLALVDRSYRRVIAVEGEDAPSFLNNLLSQKLVDAPVPFGAQALDLDAQGRVLHQMDVLVWENTIYLDCEPEDFDGLLDYLNKMVFWSKVEISTPDIGVLTLAGVLPEVEPTVPYRRMDLLAVPSMDLLVPRDAMLEVAGELIAQGAQAVGLMAYHAERVRALAPVRHLDLDGKSIPHESPSLLAHGVHLHKGCYRGQETVARVENLGRSPRVLVLFHLDGSAPSTPVPGDAITAAGSSRALGRIGTVVHDHEYGPIALGLLKRSALQRNDLQAGEVAVAVDPDSVPAEGGTPLGRQAIERLQGK